VARHPSNRSRPPETGVVAANSSRAFLVGLLRKPATWLISIVAAVIATALTGILTDALKPVTERANLAICNLSSAPPTASDQTRFRILVSPLAGDSDRAMTKLVREAFLRDTDTFHVIQTCESLDIKNDADLDIAKQNLLAQAIGLITRNNANLLLFGSVNSGQASLTIWAVNEHGGCGFDPDHPIVLRNGALPSGFDQQTTTELTNGALKEVAAACDNPKQVDWSLFAKRVTKFGPIVHRFRASLGADEAEAFTSAYAMAMALVFANTGDAMWFDKAAVFDLEQINAIHVDTSTVIKSTRWGDYGALLMAKAKKTDSSSDRKAAIAAFEKAYEFDSKNDRTLRNLGVLHSHQGEYDLALRYHSEEIRLYADNDPDLADAYRVRAVTYKLKDDYTHAADDYRQMVRLQPSNPDAWEALCAAEATIGQLEKALSACNESLRLDPNKSDPFESRGWTYLKRGELDQAISDFNSALKIAPKDANALYGRGLALKKKGDVAAGSADIAAATAIESDIAEWFVNHGFK
jgi:tetratricopeptide (TPR) repeat protein